MKYTVLLLDDRDEILEVLEIQYRDHPNVLQVYVAKTIAEAMEILRIKPIDVVSCDIQLGNEDGFEFCSLAHEAFPDLFITMCSLEASETNRRKATGCGAKYFLPKPVSHRDIDGLFQAVALSHTKDASREVGDSDDWLDEILSKVES